MDKKIGKLITLFLLLCSSINAGEIVLRALDMQGKPLLQAVAGIPFILEARVTSKNSIPGVPQIAGLEHVSVEDKGHVSTINTIINGVRSTKKIYQYHVVVDKLGVYTFGPALLVNNKRRLQSNSITLEVLSEQKAQRFNEPFLSLSVDKKQVVLGEPVLFTIRFYPVKSVNLEGLSEPTLRGFSSTKLEGPYSGSQEIEGQQFNYIEWRSQLYPKEIGELKIPPVTAIYKAQRPLRSNALDLFDRLFDGGLDKKQIYSNALTLSVEPLPEHTQPVDAIGSFKAVSAFVDHTKAQEGEGIVYSLVIEGSGDLQAISAPTLVMPGGLKYYDSKSTISHTTKKVFEYIIQGVKPGSWEIPPQAFTFFDLAKREYVTLKSNAIEVVINKNDEHTLESVDEKKEENVAIILPLETEGPWVFHKSRALSWLLFFIIIALMLLFPLYKIFRYLFNNYTTKNMRSLLQKRAYKNAQKAISYAYDINDVQSLHTVFINFFADKQMVLPEKIDEDYIAQLLVLKNMSLKEQEEWREFFSVLIQYKFSPDGHRQQQGKDIFLQAKDWLATLERIV